MIPDSAPKMVAPPKRKQMVVETLNHVERKVSSMQSVADLGGGQWGPGGGGWFFGPVLKGGLAGRDLLAGRPKILGEGEMKTYIRH